VIHVITLSSTDAEWISCGSKTLTVPNVLCVKYGKPLTQRIRHAIAMPTVPRVLPSTIQELILRINRCAI
jgi:hypothetical protein